MAPKEPSNPNDPGERPSDLVLLNVAAHANENPEDLPPLGETVDPEALNDLLASTTNCVVTITYAGFLVTATASNAVDVQALSAQRTS